MTLDLLDDEPPPSSAVDDFIREIARAPSVPPPRDEPVARLERGDVVGGRFEIGEWAGAGGMGIVYRARDREARPGNEVVALKVLREPDPGGRARFEREARLLADIEHPGIVRYVAHGDLDHGAYLAMEWLDGEDLAARLRAEEIAVDDAVELVRRIADALGAAHARGVVHRDVKPSNVFLVRGDLRRARLLDFGVARPAAGRRTLTRRNAVVGTPGYMAPEQARGDREIDARADVFSLGCVLFECLAGRSPFAAPHDVAVLAKILVDEAPRVGSLRAGVSERLEGLVARMLAKLPRDRPADGACVAAELAAIASDGTSAARARPSVRPGALSGREQEHVTVALALAGGLGVAGASAAEIAVFLAAEVDRARASATTLQGGAFLFTFGGSDGAHDRAARAASFALALRARVPGASIALATGRALFVDALPVGDAIDRAAAFLREDDARTDEASPSPAPLRVCDVTAALVGGRFVIEAEGDVLVVTGPRDEAVPRTLLGKPAPFVGRELEIALLTALYRQCADERTARVALVTGPAGAGKSRLRHELLRTLGGEEAPTVWFAQGDPLSAGTAFGVLSQAIRRAAGMRDDEPLPAQRHKLRARVDLYVALPERAARVAEFLGEMVGAKIADAPSVELRSARENPILMGDQIRAAFHDLVACECERRPLVIVVDDVQWADRTSLSLLDTALGLAAGRPLFVLALGRPETHDVFPSLFAARDAHAVRLPPLTRRASDRLVQEVLGDGVTPSAAARLTELAAGNPFYLEELTRAYADAGDGGLPETVVAMAAARLEGLDPVARRVLRAGSVFGEVFWASAVSALLGDDGARAPLDVDGWLDELVRRELVTPRVQDRFRGEREFAFRHAHVRDAAYATLTDVDRTLGHRLAADWLEAAGATDPNALGEHCERGDLPERAIQHHRRAAEQALEGNDLDAAIARAERAAALGASGAVLGALRRVQTEAQVCRGDNAAAELAGAHAMKLLARGSVAWCAGASLRAVAASRISRADVIEEIGAEFLALLAGADLSGALLGGASRVAIAASMTGVNEIATLLLDAIEVALPRASADPPAMARIDTARARRAHLADDPVGYCDLSVRAVAWFDAAGDARGACQQRTNLGNALAELGAFDEAVLVLRDALAAAQRLGLLSAMSSAESNLGLALGRLGRFAEAEATERRAIAAAVAQGDHRLESSSRAYLSYALCDQGDLAGAVREARAAVALLPENNSLRLLAEAALARALLASDDAEGARAVARAAISTSSTRGGVEEGEALTRLVLARALASLGDAAAARDEIERAGERLLERSSMITDPDARERFLRSIPEHAATLDLWEATKAAERG